MSIATPVLFLIFNRPELTHRVFDQIRLVRPQQLYIAADGPRTTHPDDYMLCIETRKVVDKIDWDCELQTLFREDNLGCGLAVSGAITWFFDHVEEGIILEDDCLPNLSFFTYCENLLSRYRDEDRVMHIGANNFQYGRRRGIATYYYSRFAHVWGWATWRRAWNKFNFEIPNRMINSPDQYMPIQLLKDTKDRKVDTWDIQWTCSILEANGLAICPQISLVQNIGFSNGTNYKDDVPFFYQKVKFSSIRDIVYNIGPIKANDAADLYTREVLYPRSLYERIRSRLILKLA